MKSKKIHRDIVNITTLGCSKNMVDSEVLSGQLLANGIEVKHESVKPDYNISIINTCGFIDKAKEESINTILEHVALKEEGLLEKVYVTGCLSERYKGDLETEIPGVDAWFGTMELPNILKAFEADYKAELVGERLLSTPTHYAYLKISEGCNRTCSFCAIPLMRGKHVSKTIEDLVTEATSLAQKGVKEIMLIAQELTYYGLDIYKERKLADLLNALCEIEGIEWIRLHYAYPHKFPMDIIEVIKAQPKICNYLDMPLQHISDNMLKAMKRQITRKEIVALINDIRKVLPSICIRTTLIAGFPGETQEDVDDLKSFLEEMQFDRVGVFTYSHEDGTSAYALEDTLSQEEKEARAEEIMAVQQDISLAKNESKIGKTFKVIIDKKESGRFIGRTEYDSVEVDNEVIINTTKRLKPGDFVNVTITKAYDYDLEGVLI
ncbi:MAG: 30S ribosomal protein S12 methylthiotransferase RimO [Bacteroidetes bacterium]|jgi:ribosomal protein S12 methylthiotransferase|nr:30S ribosomal protein S12 methylthiotransferase RimO [Bacteroidota bacterium]MBK7587188.1 30S ribosomal protein S12 methylthiotransferase RimO [Bacteroidota bacterium]MBK9300241.1 30S ribosomal protein S12 methylthiotransferase RimO [Bacteroidota bacterium]MBK9482868.1 30S ribosomal protein S12 methylthiotransferase RimO [Bacteroidota bacterium]